MADEILKNRQNVSPVTNDAFEKRPKLRLVPRFAIPLGENRGGNLDVPAKFLRRVPPQE